MCFICYSTSPSVHVIYSKLKAHKSCWPDDIQQGQICDRKTIAYAPDSLQTENSYFLQDTDHLSQSSILVCRQRINYTELLSPPSLADFASRALCEDGEVALASISITMDECPPAHGDNPTSPILSLPSGLSTIDPS